MTCYKIKCRKEIMGKVCDTLKIMESKEGFIMSEEKFVYYETIRLVYKMNNCTMIDLALKQIRNEIIFSMNVYKRGKDEEFFDRYKKLFENEDNTCNYPIHHNYSSETIVYRLSNNKELVFNIMANKKDIKQYNLTKEFAKECYEKIKRVWFEMYGI